jgi:hypothetical protein
MRLHVFGDSFTEGYDTFVTLHPKGHRIEWRDKYINWKGYTPKVFNTILSNKLNIDTTNYGIGGADNYTIFETIIDNMDNIQSNDIIIIGWSALARYRLANINNKFESITMWWKSASDNALERIGVSQTTINEVMINRYNNYAYVNEINKFIKLLNYTFKNNKIIHWSPFYSHKIGMNVTSIPELETIVTETNGEVDDLHFSEPSHHQLADYFYNIIVGSPNKKLI